MRLPCCTFTSSFKAELFPRLAAAFESRELLIPIGRHIREDLHFIYCAHTTPDGHADRSTALALALRAAQTAPAPGGVSIVGRKHRFLGFWYASPHTLAIFH